MQQPLAIVLYERLLPGSQLVNRLQDLHYRVLAVNNFATLAATVKRESPLLVLVDLAGRGDSGAAIQSIKSEAATAHVPIIAFAPDDQTESLAAATLAGANFTVTYSSLMAHLSRWLDQALHVD